MFQVKGGDSSPDYYRLGLLLLQGLSPEQVCHMETEARSGRLGSNGDFVQKEADVVSMLNLVR